MPVGTGSINRAARSSKKTTEAVKNETKVVKGEAVKAEAVEAVVAEAVATSKPAEKPAKKPAEAKATAEKAEPKKAQELRVYGDETVFVAGNECCHLTEELPVHLL